MPQRIPHPDLLGLVAAVLISTLMIIVAGPVWLKLVPFAILFIAPSYSLVALAFPGFPYVRDSSNPLPGQWALVVGLAVVVMPLVGLMLALLPSGLTRTPLLIAINLATILGAGVAAIRRPSTFRTMPGQARTVAWPTPGRIFFGLALVCFVVVLLAGIVTPRTPAPFSEFALIPDANGIFATTAQVNGTYPVTVSIANREGNSVGYRVNITAHIVSQPESLVMTGYTVTLPADGTDRREVALVLPRSGDYRIDFTLWNESSGQAYRELHIYVKARAAV